MSLGLLLRLVAGLVVLAVVVFTVLLVRHVREEPLGGVFERLVPVGFESAAARRLPEPGEALPELDPGLREFERARERIAVGDLIGARDKLRTVVNIYPRSRAAPEARRIVGEMNLDELLSPAWREGKQLYEVQRGDSYLAIAGRFRTSLDMLMHLNGLMDLKSLQPGDELLVMPLDFKLRIEPGRGTLSLWDEERFVVEYPIARSVAPPGRDLETTIASRGAVADGRRVSSLSPDFRGAEKVLELEQPPLLVAVLPGDAAAEELARGFYLERPAMEELALLLRPGNEVEIRVGPR